MWHGSYWTDTGRAGIKPSSKMALKGAFAVFHISIPENYRDKLVETDDRGESDRRLVRPTCREGGVSDMTRGGERKRRFNLKIALIYISQLGPR